MCIEILHIYIYMCVCTYVYRDYNYIYLYVDMYTYYICLLGGDSKILASCQALFHRFALDGEVQKESERSEAAKQRPSFRMVIGKSWENHGKIYTIHILHEGVNGIGIHFPLW